MLPRISLERALSRQWDVIVAGTSFAAMFFARGLPPDLSVLFVEKGSLQSHQDQIADGIAGAEEFEQLNASGLDKDWIAHTKFGGNSNCWTGQTPRFHPHDFRLQSLYGVGEDWPISYEDLEPHYLEVERVMEIAGGGTDRILPRSAPFPYPAHTPSLSDRRFQAEHPDIWVPAAVARSNGGSRPNCCNNGVCGTCPIDSKFTILNGIDAFARQDTAVLLDTELRAVHIGNGTARGVQVRASNGHTAEIRGNLVALGANAIFNAAILMRSGLGAPALGRYLHEQTSRNLRIDVPIPNFFGGTFISGFCYGFYDGAHRRDRGAVLIENSNIPVGVRPEPGKWTWRLFLKVIAEDLPLAENRVELTEAGEPRLVWQGHSEYGARGREWAAEKIAEVLPVEIEALRILGVNPTEAHIQGTHRMGRDPSTSVVDATLRCHGVHNLLALGAGAFPTCSAANPTLTLAALSLHAGRSLR